MSTGQELRLCNIDVILFASSEDVHYLTGIMQLVFGSNLRKKGREKERNEIIRERKRGRGREREGERVLTGAPLTENDFSKSTRICCERSY